MVWFCNMSGQTKQALVYALASTEKVVLMSQVFSRLRRVWLSATTAVPSHCGSFYDCVQASLTYFLRLASLSASTPSPQKKVKKVKQNQQQQKHQQKLQFFLYRGLRGKLLLLQKSAFEKIRFICLAVLVTSEVRKKSWTISQSDREDR